MKINKTEILPGENKIISIPVANLPSGTAIDLKAFVYRSKNEGPTMLVLGGVHGDEINGVEIVRKAIQDKYFDKLKAGSVIAIPLLNVFGFLHFSREFPGGKDINRSFPGSQRGSLASRVAYALTKQIIPHVDFGLDFHTGGNQVYNYPQARYYKGDENSEKLAMDFGMPYTISSGLIKKSIRKTAFDHKIPMVVFEGGESSRLDSYSIEVGLEGLQRVMQIRGFKDFKVNTNFATQVLESGTWLRSPKSGVVVLHKFSGDTIEKGEIIGVITDPYCNFLHKVKSTVSGVIYGHNNNPVINQGDALIHVGFLE